jgi:ABC-type glycerol-3-phosphate transport system permease component
MKIGRLSGRVSAYVVLIVFASLALFPLVFAGVTSLKTDEGYRVDRLGLPNEITFVNYERAIVRANLGQFILNTLIVLPFGLLLYIFLCNAVGVAFGMLRFRGRMALFTATLVVMIFPQMMIAVPIYRIVLQFGLLNTRVGIIFVWVAYFAPYGTYIMTTFYSSAPRELFESARIDGAGIFKILFRVLMPVAMPMIATIGIIGFQSMWNELPFSLLILQDAGLRTIAQGLAIMQGEYGLRDPAATAALIVGSVIPVVVYLIFQKRIQVGATAGSVKG